MHAHSGPPFTFPNFPELPPELRNAIWDYALPWEQVTCGVTTLVPFKPGLWGPQDETNPDSRILFDLDKLLVPIPLALAQVNHEARSIALHWAKSEGLKQIPARDHGIKCPLFARPFRQLPELEALGDALYFGPGQIEEFIEERRSFPGLIDESSYCCPVATLAMTEAVAYKMFANEEEDYDPFFYGAWSLYVIEGTGPDFEPEGVHEGDGWFAGPWSLEPVSGDSYRFDGMRLFEREHERDLNDGVIAEVLGGGPYDGSIHVGNIMLEQGFELRPAMAVRMTFSQHPATLKVFKAEGGTVSRWISDRAETCTWCIDWYDWLPRDLRHSDMMTGS